jgi:hypothetical protein
MPARFCAKIAPSKVGVELMEFIMSSGLVKDIAMAHQNREAVIWEHATPAQLGQIAIDACRNRRNLLQ